jgi:SAM-dependent methyltransferase
MDSALYDTLTPWYALLDAREHHEDEVAAFLEGLTRAILGPRETLLELGAGAGNNAFFAKAAYRCTLTDISEPMLALSRGQNPECEHIAGDMRSLRLGRTFDAVLVHDAIVYMRTEAELREALETAFVHTRPGGAAIIAPDCMKEEFHEYSQLHEGNEGTRSLRCLEWSWDPDPTDTTYTVEYAFLLREGAAIQAVRDTHIEGLFERATWERLLREVGFEVELLERPLEDADPVSRDAYASNVFLCRRPS